MTSERELIARTRQRLRDLLRPESDFLWVIIIYGIAISLLTLAVPVAVQFLINTIVNIGSFRAVVVLSLTLLLILMASGALSALRLWAVELYERRILLGSQVKSAIGWPWRREITLTAIKGVK